MLFLIRETKFTDFSLIHAAHAIFPILNFLLPRDLRFCQSVPGRFPFHEPLCRFCIPRFSEHTQSYILFWRLFHHNLQRSCEERFLFRKADNYLLAVGKNSRLCRLQVFPVTGCIQIQCFCF